MPFLLSHYVSERLQMKLMFDRNAGQNVMAAAGLYLRKEGLNDGRQISSLGSTRLYARVRNAHTGSSFISRQQILGV